MDTILLDHEISFCLWSKKEKNFFLNPIYNNLLNDSIKHRILLGSPQTCATVWLQKLRPMMDVEIDDDFSLEGNTSFAFPYENSFKQININSEDTL